MSEYEETYEEYMDRKEQYDWDSLNKDYECLKKDFNDLKVAFLDLVGVGEFYGDGEIYGTIDNYVTYSNMMEDDLGTGDFPITEDVDDNHVSGRRAREVLHKYKDLIEKMRG